MDIDIDTNAHIDTDLEIDRDVDACMHTDTVRRWTKAG